MVVKDVPEGCTVVGVPGHVTTRCGVRVHTKPAHTDRRRQYLPDPMEQTVEILTARIAQLEEQVASLTEKAAAQDVRFQPDGGPAAHNSATEE